MRKNKFHIVSFLFLGTILLSGCSFGSKVEQTISSEDGLFSITIPAGWTEITNYALNDVADIQAQNRFRTRFVVVLVTDKEDFLEEYTFEEWKEYVMESTLSGWDNGIILSVMDTEIDGQPAKQYELEGSIEPTRIKMLATYIDGENYLAQILTWTLASRYNASVEEFRAITNSIQGLN